MLFNFILFPGFLFTAVIGMVASWIDRKVTARVQFRVGPPLLQPLYDFTKLLGKEIIVPEGGSKTIFLFAPIIGITAVTIVSSLLWLSSISIQYKFVGDLIVVLYLLTIPSIMPILGGFASKNPLASVGASREMKLILSYELPFILAIFVPVILSGGIIDIAGLVEYQKTNGIFLNSASGIIAFVVVVLCMQAKLTLNPFDIPEAEQEIMGGTYIEYSGLPLGIFKLTNWMMLCVMPIFLINMFLGGINFSGIQILWGILKYVLLLVIIILIRNTNPRIKIDQAVRFFWKVGFGLSVIAVLLAILKV